MTQIDATGVTFSFSAFDPDDVDFATNVSNTPFSQTWDTTDPYRITALSFLGDITPGLGGTVNAINITDTIFSNGFSISGLDAPLTSFLDTGDAANNHRKFWDTALEGETTILTPAISSDFRMMGDFVRVATGESRSGADDSFLGTGTTFGSGVFVGDALTVNAGGSLTGGADSFTGIFGSFLIGDVGDGNLSANILGSVIGGDDTFTLIDTGYNPSASAGLITGDVGATGFGSTLTGGDDTITLRNLSSTANIYGDLFNAGGTVTGGDDTILAETTIEGRGFMSIATIFGDGESAINSSGTFTATGGDDTITANNVNGSDFYGDFSTTIDVTFIGGDDMISVAGTFDLPTPSPSFQVTPSLGSIFGDTSSASGGDNHNYIGGADHIMVSNAGIGPIFGDTSSFGSSGNSTFTGGDDTIDIHFSRGDQSYGSTMYGDAASVDADVAIMGDDTITVDLIGSQNTNISIYADLVSYDPGGSVNGDFTGGDDTVIFNGAVGQNSMIFGDASSLSASSDLVIEYGDDDLTGGQGADSIYGDTDGSPTGGGITSEFGGDDILDGRGGNDRLFGGLGSDTAAFDSLDQAVVVFLEGIPGTNPLDPLHAIGQGNDRFDSIENVIGSSQNDLIVGDGNANVIAGGGGNDNLRGGGGDDTFVFAFATDDCDTIIETSGDDDLQVTDSSADSLTYRRSGDHLVIEKDGTTGKVVISDQYGGPGGQVEEFIGLSGTFELSSTLSGTAADQILVGMSSDETINGAGGDDIISGGGGADELTGGAGDDEVRGGLGNDVYRYRFASSDDDLVSEVNGGGTDTLVLIQSDSEDVTFRRSGSDLIIEDSDFAGRVIIEDQFSGVATDRVEFIQTDDGVRFLKTTLTGNSASEVIVGSSSAETLDGGGGSDVLFGGGAKDQITGGTGADVFSYSSVSESTAAAAGRDTIFDFNQSENDVIALSGIDANTGVAGDNAFVFLGQGATTGAGTLAYSFVGSNTLVQADVDGGGADFSILLGGNITLTASDFIL